MDDVCLAAESDQPLWWFLLIDRWSVDGDQKVFEHNCWFDALEKEETGEKMKKGEGKKNSTEGVTRG